MPSDIRARISRVFCQKYVASDLLTLLSLERFLDHSTKLEKHTEGMVLVDIYPFILMPPYRLHFTVSLGRYSLRLCAYYL